MVVSWQPNVRNAYSLYTESPDCNSSQFYTAIVHQINFYECATESYCIYMCEIETTPRN